MKKTYYILLVLLMSALVLTLGCKTKHAVTEKPKTTTKAGNKIIDSALGAQPVFKDASASNVKLTLETKDRKISASSNIEINYDEAIKVSVKIMGIEMAIAEIRLESIRLIDKLNRRYADATYADIEKMIGIPITYKDIQALICNQVFCLGTPNDKLKSLRPQTTADDAGNTIATIAGTDYDMQFTFQQSDSRITNTMIKLTGKQYTLSTSYDQFKTEDSVNFPHDIIFEVKSAKRSGKVTFKLPNASFNKGAFTSPYSTNKLTKVPLSTFMQYLN